MISLAQETGNYGRMRRAIGNMESRTGLTAVYNRNGAALLTKGQMKVMDSRVTTAGRDAVLNKAANGQSVG